MFNYLEKPKGKYGTVDPDPIPLLIFIASLSLYGGMVATEIAFVRLNRAIIRTQSAAGSRRAQTVDTLLEQPLQLLSTTTIVKSISALLATGISVHVFGIAPFLSNTIGAVIVVWLLLALLYITLRAWANAKATSIALQISPVIRVLVLCLQPITALWVRATTSFFGSAQELEQDGVFLNEDRLKLLIDASQHDDNIPENERQMIESILDLEGTTVREVMVPRIDMVTLDVHTTLHKALDAIIDAGHSRIPVYEENVDHIIGILYAKDLLQCLRDQRTDIAIIDQMRPVYFVPNSKKLTELFQEMQKQRVHIAMIVDEYGGTAGLVTIEDLLEEIVGEIQDEYDPDEESLVESVGLEAYILSPRLHIDDLADLLGLTIEEENADTLGGLIFRLAGHVPLQSELVEYEGWQFTVLSLDGNKIERVRVEPLSPMNGSNVTVPSTTDANVLDSQHSKSHSALNLSTFDQT